MRVPTASSGGPMHARAGLAKSRRAGPPLAAATAVRHPARHAARHSSTSPAAAVRAGRPPGARRSSHTPRAEPRPGLPSTEASPPPPKQPTTVVPEAALATDAVAAATARAEGPSADLRVIAGRALKIAAPYWTDPGVGKGARWRAATVIGLTLGTTGVSVLFNFLGRDFFNALAEKDAARFTAMLGKWVAALAFGVPVFVFRDYYQSLLSLEWRQWLTARLSGSYLSDRAFYRLASGSSGVDNPDQRITADAAAFTDAVLGLALTCLSAAVDLLSFSGILYSIYPPLFGALLVYALGGTAASIALGRPLVPLNFAQEAAEADLRYALVRVRENAEAVAFYGGEAGEAGTLRSRLAAVVANGAALLRASRNLAFFTSGYRYFIQVLPAAVVAPLYFKGAIEFGVVNQSSSAFNHILSDISIIVYQIDNLAGLAAVVDRLGQFDEAVEAAAAEDGGVRLLPRPPSSTTATAPLLSARGLTLYPPGPADARGDPLVRDLSFDVGPGGSLLIVGPSGAGKTSILRAAAGLWTAGSGSIARVGVVAGEHGNSDDPSAVFFVPQRPYMVLGSLRDQLLYPVWASGGAGNGGGAAADEPGLAPLARVGRGGGEGGDATTPSPAASKPRPTDAELEAALRSVRLGVLLDRADTTGRVSGTGLDATADWASILSLGEQQRLAFARVLLAKPALVLMDESTSALDVDNEAAMYRALGAAGVAYVSVGHRPTLAAFHADCLRLSAAAAGAGVQSDWEVGSAANLAGGGGGKAA